MATAAQYAAEARRRAQQSAAANAPDLGDRANNTPASSNNPNRNMGGVTPAQGAQWGPNPAGSAENVSYYEQQLPDTFHAPMSPTPWNKYGNAVQQNLQGQQGGGPQYYASSGGGGGGGGYGGGGGGGGGASAADKAAYNAYAAAMMKLIGQQGGPPAPAANPLDAMINPAVDNAVQVAQGAYRDLAGRISTADPYARMQNTASPQLRAEMERFLQGQGVDGGQYGNAVTAANAQLGAGTQNWNNFAQAAGTNHVAGQQGLIDTAMQQGQGIVSNYETQRMQLQAMAAAQNAQAAREQQLAEYQAQQQRAQAIMQLLGQGLQYGVTPDVSGMTV